jgi:DNA-binding NtrC family response regulator
LRQSDTIKKAMEAQGVGGSGMHHEPRLLRALVVEDDASLCRTLVHALAPWASEVRVATTLVEARWQFEEFRPELVVLDFKLPDGTATDVLANVHSVAPLPAIVALSAFADPGDAFALAEVGVRAYLQKPVRLGELNDAIKKALTEPPPLSLSARQAVGHVSLKEAEEALRRTMVKEALERVGGNRRGAARMLGISRELLQHVLRKLGAP